MEPNKRIHLCLARMSDEGLEQKYVKEAFDSNWIAPLGPNVDAFESDLENYISTEHQRVIALSSGTAALHLALIECGVQAGDEVLVQSLTFCASSNPVLYLGAVPIFIDSEMNSWNLDPELLEEVIKDRMQVTGRKPKAIIPVALFGMPYDVEAVMRIAEKYDIPVIEDAAEALGSKYKDKFLGTFGRFGVFSFNGNKMITTSGGGALVCPSEEAYNETKWYATQAREARPYYEHQAMGFNYRMSNICAGVGRGQMSVLQHHVDHHKMVHALYRKFLSSVKGITLHEQPSESYDSNFWLSAILLDENVRIKTLENIAQIDGGPNRNVEALRKVLDSAGVEARSVWKPMHLQPLYCKGEVQLDTISLGGKSIVRQTSESSVSYVNGISQQLFLRGLCLPSGPYVSEKDVEYICQLIIEHLE